MTSFNLGKFYLHFLHIKYGSVFRTSGKKILICQGKIIIPPGQDNHTSPGKIIIIVAFLENATIGYSLESLCVCVCVRVCVCVCVFAR